MSWIVNPFTGLPEFFKKTSNVSAPSINYPVFHRSVTVSADGIFSIRSSTASRVSSASSGNFSTLNKIFTVSAGGVSKIETQGGLLVSGG